MMSIIPGYSPPDFSAPHLASAPKVQVQPAPADGVVPENFHGTSNHPEYLHLGNGSKMLSINIRWLIGNSSFGFKPNDARTYLS